MSHNTHCVGGEEGAELHFQRQRLDLCSFWEFDFVNLMVFFQLFLWCNFVFLIVLLIFVLCLSLTHLLRSARTSGESGQRASQGRTSGWTTLWMETRGRKNRMGKLASRAVMWKAVAVAQPREKEGKMLFSGEEGRRELEQSCGRWAWRDREVGKPVWQHGHCLLRLFPRLSCNMAGSVLLLAIQSRDARLLVVPVFIPWDTRARKALVQKSSPHTHIFHTHEGERTVVRKEPIQASRKTLCPGAIFPGDKCFPIGHCPPNQLLAGMATYPISRGTGSFGLLPGCPLANLRPPKAPEFTAPPPQVLAINPKHFLQTTSIPKAALGSLHHTPPQGRPISGDAGVQTPNCQHKSVYILYIYI